MGWGGLNVSQNMFIKAVGGDIYAGVLGHAFKRVCESVYVSVLLLNMLVTTEGPVIASCCYYSFFSLSSSIIEKQ